MGLVLIVVVMTRGKYFDVAEHALLEVRENSADDQVGAGLFEMDDFNPVLRLSAWGRGRGRFGSEGPR